MVADTTAVGLEHPYGILLALVEVGNAQLSEVKVGKRLVRAVEFGSHKTVEKTVVPVGELLFEGIGCAPEPIDKALSDFFYFGIRNLYGMSVSYFNGFGLSRNLIRHFIALVDIGNAIVKCMLQEIATVIAKELAQISQEYKQDCPNGQSCYSIKRISTLWKSLHCLPRLR